MKRLLTVLSVIVPVAKWLASEQNRMKVKNVLGRFSNTPSLGKK